MALNTIKQTSNFKVILVEELYGLVHLFDRNWDVIDEKNEYILQKEYAQGVSEYKMHKRKK